MHILYVYIYSIPESYGPATVATYIRTHMHACVHSYKMTDSKIGAPKKCHLCGHFEGLDGSQSLRCFFLRFVVHAFI